MKKRQHQKPCGECPYRRTSRPGYCGGIDPSDFRLMGQSEARMPCHSHFPDGVNYEAAQSPGTCEAAAPQCAGRAIHWSNQVKTQFPGSNLLELPKDHDMVFSWPQEFIAHHITNGAEEMAHSKKTKK